MLRVLAVRVGARKRGPFGDLTAETGVRTVVDTRLAGRTVASPQAGRLSRRSRGPNCIWGCDLRSEAQRIAPPPSIASGVRSPKKTRGPSSTLLRSLLHVPPAPATVEDSRLA